MTKKRSADYLHEAPDIATNDYVLTFAQKEALAELYRSAKAVNGADHMKLCAFYVVNSQHCDCGLQSLRMSVLALEATKWAP